MIKKITQFFGGAFLSIWLSSTADAQMTVSQTVQVQAPFALKFSPDGKSLVYVARKASISSDRWEYSLFVVSGDSSPRLLVQAAALGAVQWSRDGERVIYLAESNDGYQAWSVERNGGEPRQLTRHPGGLASGLAREWLEESSAFRVSPDGRRALFVTGDRALAERQLAAAWQGSFVYTGFHDQGDVGVPRLAWKRMPGAAGALWMVDLETGREVKIWQPSVDQREGRFDPLSWYDWSPDGTKIGLTWSDRRPPANRMPLVIITVEGLNAKEALPDLGHTLDAEWSSDSSSISFRSEGLVVPGTVRYQLAQYRYTLESGQLARISSTAPSNGDFADRVEAETGDRVHGCAASSDQTRLACIRENPIAPPEVVIYPVSSTAAIGRGTVISDLNPELAQLQMGQVEPIEGRSADGKSSGLILPVGYRSGVRYPLVVMQYNLYNRHNFSGVTGFTSYAPQVFAARGYVVLLHNLPAKTFLYPRNDFAAARANEADGVSDSLRAILDRLIARGLVDSDRMGIMGWSWGGFFTPYILTHHPKWFAVGAMGEGGNHQPSTYWVGPDSWREQEDGFFGPGGPYGPHADRWKAVAPVHNMNRLRAPLLMEYSGGYLAGLDLYQAARSSGRQAELHIYQNEEHVFDRPSNQLASMQRHLDWFDFWLRGAESSDPAQAEQYQRWRELRRLACERDATQIFCVTK